MENIEKSKTGEMTQWGKSPLTKPDDLSLILSSVAGTHMMEGKN